MDEEKPDGSNVTHLGIFHSLFALFPNPTARSGKLWPCNQALQPCRSQVSIHRRGPHTWEFAPLHADERSKCRICWLHCAKLKCARLPLSRETEQAEPFDKNSFWWQPGASPFRAQDERPCANTWNFGRCPLASSLVARQQGWYVEVPPRSQLKKLSRISLQCVTMSGS